MENLPKPQFPKASELPLSVQPWGTKLIKALVSFADDIARRQKRIIAIEKGESISTGAPTASHKVKIDIDGTEYYIGLDEV